MLDYIEQPGFKSVAGLPFILLFSLLHICSTTACASQIYIDSLRGSDNNDGSADAPFRTLNRARMAAASALTGGDEVILAGGSIFREALVCGEFGSGQNSSARLLFRGSSLDKSTYAILQGSLLMQPLNYGLASINSAAWSLDSMSFLELNGGIPLAARGSTPATIIASDIRQGSAAIELGNSSGDQHHGLALSQSSLANLGPRNALTFAAWVKFLGDSGGAQTTTIAGFYGENGNQAWRLYKSSSGNLRISYSPSGAGASARVISFANAIPAAGEWQFIVVRYDREKFTVFMFDADGGPGVRLGTTPDVMIQASTSNSSLVPASSIFPSTADFVIGADGTDEPVNSGHAQYDGLMLFTEALTDSEIKQLALGWYDGSDNPWQGPDAQGRYTIKTWAAPRSQGVRSRYRLYENGIDVMADGQEAAAAEVDAPGEYFVDESSRLLYFIPSDGAAPAPDDAIELTDASSASFNPGIGSPLRTTRDGAGAPDYIELSNLRVRYSAYQGISLTSVDSNPAEGIYIHDVVTENNNHAGIAVGGRLDTTVGERLEIRGNDHAGLVIDDLAGIRPGSFAFDDLLVMDNRRQGIAIESLEFGKTGSISNAMVAGTRSDGIMSRGIQVNSNAGDVFLENITLSDNEEFELIILGHTGLVAVSKLVFVPGALTTRLIKVDEQGTMAPLALDNNLYMTPDVLTPWQWGTSITSLFATWKSLSGQDEHSATTDRVPAPDGDISLDGVVNTADVLLGMLAVFGKRALDPEEFIHGDVAPLISNISNPDGEFNSADVMVIMRKALELDYF